MQVMKEHQLWFWGDQREEERCCEWTRWRTHHKEKGKRDWETGKRKPLHPSPHTSCVQMLSIPGLLVSLRANPEFVRRREGDGGAGGSQWHSEQTEITFPHNTGSPARRALPSIEADFRYGMRLASSSVKWIWDSSVAQGQPSVLHAITHESAWNDAWCSAHAQDVRVVPKNYLQMKIL